MKKLWRNNGLSLTLVFLFVLFWFAQSHAGWRDNNNKLVEQNQPTLSYGEYLVSAPFWRATAENWESEFLQMAGYVLLTIFLYQRGSSESKDPDESEDVDEDPARHRNDPRAPAPVRAGGWRMRLYAHSLSLAFAVLFILSFVIHLFASCAEFNEEQQAHGLARVTYWEHLGTARLWFESFQNWQSEFLAIAAMVVLTIFLRQRGSPESKQVHSPHGETGK